MPQFFSLAPLFDGSVTTARIAANAVNGTKIAMGSDAQGDILYYDGTDYVRLAAGTSGYFLKTQGAGANPTWAAGSGLSYATGSSLSGNASSISYSGLNASRMGQIAGQFIFDTGNNTIGFRFNNDSTAAHYSWNKAVNGTNTQSTGDTQMIVITGQGSNKQNLWAVWGYNTAGDIVGLNVQSNSPGGQSTFGGGAWIVGAAAVTRIDLIPSANNFASGTSLCLFLGA